MTVQDDERERELVRLFNLRWDPAHQRAGVDALLDVTVDGVAHTVEVEVKSTTGRTLSTARDVGMEHIAKWRRMLFVIGFYTKDARRPELRSCLCLTPADMREWIDATEAKVLVDFKIAARSSALLAPEDLISVCGAKAMYSIADARAILRQQWTTQQYLANADALDADRSRAYSPEAMLNVLRARAKYIAERGSTLNNPHVTKQHLARFIGTASEVNENWAARIREIAAAWIKSHESTAA
ncbi:MAG: hypothetical protein JSR43_17615 [Proteobacteria bacterium]|nr:hypothetical protein [Pseudomonadota bacterium]